MDAESVKEKIVGGPVSLHVAVFEANRFLKDGEGVRRLEDVLDNMR